MYRKRIVTVIKNGTNLKGIGKEYP